MIYSCIYMHGCVYTCMMTYMKKSLNHNSLTVNSYKHTQAYIYTSKLILQIIMWNIYRDGIKSIGDKIGMPCRHSTVIIRHT